MVLVIDGIDTIFFKDLHINGGAPTKGSLEVTVSGPATPRFSWIVSLTLQHSGSGVELVRFRIRGRALPFWRWAQAASSPCVDGEPRKDALKLTQRS